MTQNRAINSMLLSSGTNYLSQKSTSKSIVKSDDTFMDMLKDRIQASNVTNRKSDNTIKKAGSLFGKETVVASEAKGVVKDSSALKEVEASKEVKNQEDSDVENSQLISDSKTTPDIQKEKSAEQEDKEETIMSLESMIAILEELMAQLEVETVDISPVATKTQPEQILPAGPAAGSEDVSVLELLRALLEGNSQKLKALLGEMGENQPPEFKGLIEDIQKLLEKMSEESDVVNNMLELNLDVESTEMSREDLISQLRAQCGEVIEKLNKKISELKTSMTQEQKVEGEKPATTQTNSKTSAEFVSEQKSLQADVSKSKPKTDDKEKPVQANQTQKTAALEENEESIHTDFFVSTEQELQAPVNVKVGKVPMPLSEKPLTQTVTDQVMMKVKLMAGENRQEMEMHLEPENLGKLSLKIIHERGEVLAKITAENEQVKGILESNLQLLKDALEKDGLSVQSLSVSVNNGQEKDQSEQGSDERNRTYAGRLNQSQNTSSVTEAVYERSRVIRDYYDQSSQINLTA